MVKDLPGDLLREILNISEDDVDNQLIHWISKFIKEDVEYIFI